MFFIYFLFFIFSIFLLVSIYSYNPYDPGIGVSGAIEITNLGGLLGAYTASFFYFIFGIVSLLIPVLLILGFFLKLMGGSIKRLGFSFSFLILSLCMLIGYTFNLLETKNLLLFGRFPLNGGFIGELNFYFRLWVGDFVFLVIMFAFLLVSFLVGLGFNPITFKSILTKLRYKKDIKKTEEKPEGKFEKISSTKISSQPVEESLSFEIKPLNSKNNTKEKISKKKVQEETQIKEFEKTLPPPVDLLRDPPLSSYRVRPEELKERALVLISKLKEFGIEGDVVGVSPGPVITVFEFRPAPGIKISKIQGLVDDLALGLSAKSVRIVAPIPGKSVIGIEISNPKREWVYLKDILQSEAFIQSKSPLTIALGKDISGAPVVADLKKMPHLLIAGSTGSGKSIFLHSVILSLIYKATPEEVRFLMIDPKRIELSVYDGIPYLLHPVVLEPKMATKALRWLVGEMEKRYTLFEEVGARNLESYNEQFDEKLPYLVMIIDELADLMVVSSKEVETLLTRLAQMARAAGIHLLVATQRPSVDVITGLIKVNFPARISFQVTSKVDSRTILDIQGAERLLGAGDMLFMPPGSSYLQRIHGPYVSEEEVKILVDYLKSIGEPEYLANLEEIEDEEPISVEEESDYEDDKLYEAALKIAYQYGKISVSMLQRKLRIGYNRAARLVERMEEEGIVGPSDGVRPRSVIGSRKPL
ncbi:FtsK/SpoIIIE family DNA translocase [Thermodesulfobacterium hveragerdense]|uniref:FtsK/SpoIIIE family DNA translocase n=1 Tax=Thermodesulfobacterium hveragerdense TaxID=53424 RepID=UPI000687193A|nr:DNA translocase FtsK 4TM domain-containing protein [Thermodesulfobacterium hveragerdense]